MKKVGIISQARLGSSRLPGKIFKTICEKTLLQYHLERLKKTNLSVFVATTTESQDDQVVKFCDKLGVVSYQGSEQNVLSRFLKVIDAEKLDVVVRVTSDCPLIDPALISKAVARYLELDNERVYLSNSIERTYARGFDFEVFSAALLRESNEKDQSASNTEHVTPYLYSRKDPSIVLVPMKQEVDHSFLRVTVDEPSDFALIERLILDFATDQLSALEIEKILIDHPELQLINKEVVQKKV